MNDSLSKDQFDALEELGRGGRHGRESACVARNSKVLVGLKYVAHEKDGRLTLTEKGRQTLFIRGCISGLRAVSGGMATTLPGDVATFLLKKGHVVQADGGFEITQRGRESLADIDATAKD